MRIAIIGGGPAGLLAARTLANAGARIDLIDPTLAEPHPSRPQSEHIHLLPTAIWPRLERLAPGLGDTLKNLGVPRACAGAATLDGEPGGEPVAWPDRACFDAALLTRCRDAAAGIHAAHLVQSALRRGRWKLALADGTELAADAVVDASGVRRASFAAIAALMGKPVPVEHGPSGGGYASIALEAIALPEKCIGHRLKGGATDHRAILLRERGKMWRLTLQLRPGTPLPRSRKKVLAVLRAFADRRLFSAVIRARLSGQFATWVAQRPSRAALEAVQGLPDGWLPLGDALLTTPPHFGRGIAQIVHQAEILDERIRAGAGLAAIRDELCAATAQQWLQAALLEGLDSALLARLDSAND